MMTQPRPAIIPSSMQATSSTASFNPIHTPYSLSLLAEYTHTLDSLPLDLSRNFADLRELDAVLSSSMASITSKIYALTEMIERGVMTKEERLWILVEIAEEAARLKLGGEDKIRVASQAADNLKSHANHLRTLVELIPDFDASVLAGKTTYPHVAPRSFMPVNSFEPGRRRRANAGSLLNASVTDPSPVKRKRAARDDDLDVLSKSPRKDRTGGDGGRSRNNARRRAERAVSPSESLVSVTSHIPQAVNTTNPRGSNNANHSRSNGALSSTGNTTAKQSRAGGTFSNTSNRTKNAHHSNHTPNPGDGAYHITRDGLSPPASLAGTNGSSNRRGASVAASNSGGSRNQYGGTLLSSGPGYGGGGGGGGGRQAHAYGASGMANGAHSHLGLAPDWTPPNAHQLEGPGMPVQRNGNGAGLGMHQADGIHGRGVGGDVGEALDPDEDEQYCFCRNVSFGEMIACDDDSCEIEWFHLACIGLTTIPQGQWYCDACSKKRNAHRPSRGGRRKNANARATKAS